MGTANGLGIMGMLMRYSVRCAYIVKGRYRLFVD